jgi:hypothetical protein
MMLARIKEKADEEQARIDRARMSGGDDDDEGRPVRRGRGDPEDSKRVQRRVERERALRRTSEERVTNLTRENKEIKDRLARIERASDTGESEKTLKGLTDKLAALQKKLETAIEDGKTVDQANLQMEIGDALAEKKLLERDIATAKARKDEKPEEREVTPTADRPPLVDDFMRANRRWWNLPSAEKLKNAAIEIDKQIKQEIKDGDADYEEYSEGHMDELTVRLAEEAERLDLGIEVRDINGDVYEPDEDEEEGSDDDEKDDATADRRSRETNVRGKGKERGAPQGGMGGREGRRGAQSDLELARQGRARLTADDYETMRVYGLNPNDEDHRKRFAKERVRTILTEAGKAGRGSR